MSKVEVVRNEIAEDENPHVTLDFATPDGGSAVVKLTAEFDGEWHTLLKDGVEGEEFLARAMFAEQLFAKIVEGFTGE